MFLFPVFTMEEDVSVLEIGLSTYINKIIHSYNMINILTVLALIIMY